MIVVTKAELDSLISSLEEKFSSLNNLYMRTLRYSIEVTCQRRYSMLAYMYLWALSNYEMNNDGSTTGKVNYLTSTEFSTMYQNAKQLLQV